MEDFLIMAAIVAALLFKGAEVESLLTVAENIMFIVQSPAPLSTQRTPTMTQVTPSMSLLPGA